MKFSFLLDKPNADTPTYLFLMASLSDGRLKYYLKELLHPDHWSREFQRPKPVKDKALQNTLEALHRKLDRISDKLKQLSNDHKTSGKPLLKREVETELNHLLHKTVHLDKSDFFACAAEIVRDMKAGVILTRSGQRYSEGTLKNYGQSIKHLRGFVEAPVKKGDTRHSLSFRDVSLDTYRAFLSYMNNLTYTYKGERQHYSLNYIGQHIKNWKSLMDEAKLRGWHSNAIYQHEEFRTLSEETYDIYLTEAELQLIADKKISDKTRDLCRDWFVVDCFTGLRVSDLKLLHDRNLDRGMISIMNEKTNTKVVLPIHPMVGRILEKYEGRFPPPVSDQEINREIKKVAETCGLNKTVLYSVTEGGSRRDYYLKQFEMVSNHTARRSFITNLIRNKVPESMIMKLAGIKKMNTLTRYNKLSEEENAEIAAALPFFTKG